MAVRKINESTLTAIGNAIRSKTGGSALINPEDMANEIESISGKSINLLDGATYNNGYIASDGSFITAPNLVSNGEIYTDLIDVNAVGLVAIIKYPTTKTPWMAVASYDTDGNFISRDAKTSTTQSSALIGLFTLPQNTKKIRFTFRTFNDCDAILCNYSDSDWRTMN